jgi:glycosyltransferase involved in cell wall biosynthesis
MTVPRVSVIVNCFNGERYLTEALDSIFAQTLADFEVIFWDNGSTDRSADIARAYDARLRYFRAAETTPLGAARKAALEQAQGEFLAFLDTDDRWYPETLETLVRAADDANVDLCYAGIRRIAADGQPLGTLAPTPRSGNLLDALLRQFDIWVPALVVRRSALAACGLTFDPAVTASEEYCLFVQLAAERPMRSISDVVADYRIHASALTGRSTDKWADERFYTLDRLLERHPEIRDTHAAALAEAFARGHYYRARHFMATRRPGDARRELRAAMPAGGRYAALYALAWMPPGIWTLVHEWRTQRTLA